MTKDENRVGIVREGDVGRRVGWGLLSRCSGSLKDHGRVVDRRRLFEPDPVRDSSSDLDCSAWDRVVREDFDEALTREIRPAAT